MTISSAHRGARNQASITLADTGPGQSTLKLYSEAGGILLAMRTFAKPCGTITAEGRIQLLPAAANDLVVATGTPTWGEWCNGSGVPIWGAAVTGEDGPGPFKLLGTGPGLTIYAGGVLTLLSPALLG
ncbi:hypothetical protein [Acidovorax sp. sic0104]|uniref:hypothetical protein n=1 Tax=Acidovorax sp. sic0104 TaxID=2854784 RepID=UPI001C47344D|nr:hypothetical protein [Acidovorax sp. sic0104]MBV7539852.1 hypothetical protein [Acidovorax sp. sic0104]